MNTAQEAVLGLEEIGRGVSAEHHMKGLWGLGPRDGARGGGGERVWNVSCCSGGGVIGSGERMGHLMILLFLW